MEAMSAQNSKGNSSHRVLSYRDAVQQSLATKSHASAGRQSIGREATSFQGFQSPLNMESIFREEVQTFLQKSATHPTVESPAVMTRLMRTVRARRPERIESSSSSSSSSGSSGEGESSSSAASSANPPPAQATAGEQQPARAGQPATPVAPPTGERTPLTNPPPPVVDITASGSAHTPPRPEGQGTPAAPTAAAPTPVAPGAAAVSGTSAEPVEDAKLRGHFRVACRVHLKDRVHADDLQQVATELWQAASSGDLEKVVE